MEEQKKTLAKVLVGITEFDGFPWEYAERIQVIIESLLGTYAPSGDVDPLEDRVLYDSVVDLLTFAKKAKATSLSYIDQARVYRILLEWKAKVEGDQQEKVIAEWKAKEADLQKSVDKVVEDTKVEEESEDLECPFLDIEVPHLELFTEDQINDLFS